MKRKILAVTGARSEYDLMFSVYEKLANNPLIDFQIIITGPHLSENFGFTAKNIIDDGFRIADKIYNLIDSSQKIGRVISIGNQINAIAHAINRLEPDIVLVAGDREEAISTTMTCAYLNTAVAHFFGGDVAKDGNIDNSVRYAASKFAHLHFTTLQSHKNNLIRLGEDPWRIHVVGNPALDRFLDTSNLSRDEVGKRLGVKFSGNESYFVLIQHPIITQIEKQKEHIRITLDSILRFDVKCFVNYPNSDAGSFEIIQQLNQYQSRYPHIFKIFKNLERETYVNLLRHASLLLGNSSSGILEAASLKLPVINIGDRQRGRLAAANVIFVNNVQEDIQEAISKALNNTDFIKVVSEVENPYGDGDSSSRILKVLENVEVSDELIYKNITY
ncbi:MAG: UDP-N-acetylglucosamine 2-epimerase [Cyclobacteriaceae bacterium]|jgi:GDP/UDP-N,N'-diacetylbacillosamine 2-epimerase (hydrolysing)